MEEKKKANSKQDRIIYGPVRPLKYGPFLPLKKMIVQAKPLAEGIMPKRIEIPTIGLFAVVEPVGVLANGQMDVPKAFDHVGVLSPWTKPGMKGNAVMAGHFDHYTGPAIFYNLRKLQPGDQINLFEENGKKLTFQVKKVESYLTNEAPIDEIFGSSDDSHLNLITCAGKFNKKKQEHARRLVVFSDLVQEISVKDEKPSDRS
ncbi:class F sortase [Brevibacillus sp. NRS-1366]|uniref:class F sortase n=1 Tax=Brevibacillus sp. NRS-1366 TaxID=3233899 RepID=UPI003D1A6B18